ncbi:glycine N-acyltransferase-like protein 2 [Bos indicus x Bos taurus]|uniref:glycine N-acyltransferase-like protein 2 n=1 Tax=Bos indicus x Bos taurus TaxID=30522 RepID=UPI000F7D4871|nr:glycine N-acyltransferase-like protein 2 [Bos indicus x Bos taurus]
MKARGWTPALFHIRNKNPFNLEVLVDAWPEYQTVVIRPQKEIVIRGARTQCRLQQPPGASQQQGADRRLGAQRALRPGASVGSGTMARRGDIFYQKETFQNIFLNVLHARLVNEHWELGKNEKSLKYVECCLQNFEGFGVLSSEGKSISWFLTEQSCEIRMGYTFPKYRGQGHMRVFGPIQEVHKAFGP